MRLGIIGFGYWAKILARCFSQHPEFELRCIADIAPERCWEARNSFQTATVTSVPDELLATDAIDAVAIATPADTHAALVRTALQAEKHVWVEKPLARTGQEAAELALFAQHCRRTLFIDHTFLYCNSIKRIKQMLECSELERIRSYASIRTNKGKPRTDASIYHDLAIHDLAILDFLMGESPLAVSVTPPSADPDTPCEDELITLTYASGTTGSIRVNWSAPAKVRRILISSDRQTVVFDDMNSHHKLRLLNVVSPQRADDSANQLDIDPELVGRVVPLHDTRETLANAIECFLDCIHCGRQPVSDGWQGVRLATILDACLSSADAGGVWEHVASHS